MTPLLILTTGCSILGFQKLLFPFNSKIWRHTSKEWLLYTAELYVSFNAALPEGFRTEASSIVFLGLVHCFTFPIIGSLTSCKYEKNNNISSILMSCVCATSNDIQYNIGRSWSLWPRLIL